MRKNETIALSIDSRWNIRGETDGYSSKSSEVFVVPLISIGVFLLLIAISWLRPLNHNVDKSRKYYGRYVVFKVIFLSHPYLLIDRENTREPRRMIC